MLFSVCAIKIVFHFHKYNRTNKILNAMYVFYLFFNDNTVFACFKIRALISIMLMICHLKPSFHHYLQRMSTKNVWNLIRVMGQSWLVEILLHEFTCPKCISLLNFNPLRKNSFINKSFYSWLLVLGIFLKGNF